jgi:hypothetical protein
MSGTGNNKNQTLMIEGVIKDPTKDFTPLQFFNGWQDLHGIATMKKIEITNGLKIKICYGIMALLIPDTELPNILERCDTVFSEYTIMIREPTNKYIQFIDFNGTTKTNKIISLLFDE